MIRPQTQNWQHHLWSPFRRMKKEECTRRSIQTNGKLMESHKRFKQRKTDPKRINIDPKRISIAYWTKHICYQKYRKQMAFQLSFDRPEWKWDQSHDRHYFTRNLIQKLLYIFSCNISIVWHNVKQNHFEICILHVDYLFCVRRCFGQYLQCNLYLGSVIRLFAKCASNQACIHFHVCFCVHFIYICVWLVDRWISFSKIYVWKTYSLFGWIDLLWRKFNRYNKCNISSIHLFFLNSSHAAVVKWIDSHLSFVYRIWAHVLKQIIIKHAHNSNEVAKNNQYAHKSEINTCLGCVFGAVVVVVIVVVVIAFYRYRLMNMNSHEIYVSLYVFV